MSELDNVQKVNPNQDDEISLIDLFAIIWKRKTFVIFFSIICAVGVTLYAYISIKLPPEESYLPNQYTAKAIMMINSSSSSSSLSSALSSSGLSSLAGLMGVASSGGSSNGQLALYIINTDSFIDALAEELDVVSRFDLVDSEFPKTARRAFFKDEIKGDLNSSTGILEIQFTHIDKEFATEVVNCAVRLLEEKFKSLGLDENLLKKENLQKTLDSSMAEMLSLEAQMRELETGSSIMQAGRNIPRITIEVERLKREITIQEAIYTQMRQEYELLKISMNSETPIFQVLEYAEVPEKKSEPSRAIICMIGTVAGFFVAIFLCFVFNIIENFKKDDEAMAKLGMKKKGKKTDE